MKVYSSCDNCEIELELKKYLLMSTSYGVVSIWELVEKIVPSYKCIYYNKGPGVSSPWKRDNVIVESAIIIFGRLAWSIRHIVGEYDDTDELLSKHMDLFL